MGNCPLKCDNKLFNLHQPTLLSGHVKKIVNGIKKSPVKYFATGIH